MYNQNTIEKWTKCCILPFLIKGDLGITKNYSSITLTATAMKVYSWENSKEKSKWISEKLINNFSDSDYSSNHQNYQNNDVSWTQSLGELIPIHMESIKYSRCQMSRYKLPFSLSDPLCLCSGPTSSPCAVHVSSNNSSSRLALIIYPGGEHSYFQTFSHPAWAQKQNESPGDA